MLLVGAGLFLRSLQNLRHVDWGFDTSHVLVAGVDPRGSRIHPRAAHAALRARASSSSKPSPACNRPAFPCIRCSAAPPATSSVEVEGYTYRRGRRPSTPNRSVDLAVLRDRRHAPARRPRLYRSRPRRRSRGYGRQPHARRTLLSEPFGGRRPHLDRRRPKDKFEIVGVVDDVHFRSAGEEPNVPMFIPVAALPGIWTSLEVRSSGDPAAMRLRSARGAGRRRAQPAGERASSPWTSASIAC